MKISVIRHLMGPTFTHGKMFIDNVFFAHTLEDTFRDLHGDISKKVHSKTCIDPGEFEVKLSFSNHFQRTLPEILNVPCFAGIRIHGGNTAADTEGCILIGEQSDNNGKIWNCGGKLKELIDKLTAANGATISVVNQPALAV
jgi:hypothetical protein